MSVEDSTASPARRLRRQAIILGAVMAVQGVCVALLLADALADIFIGDTEEHGMSETLHNALEMGIVLALVSGFVATGFQTRTLLRRAAVAERQLQAASGAFQDLVEEHFATWGLTPAEREVALFSIKGLSNADIAGLRDTREGTVKAQLNAIYAKAGVTGRPQLLALFIEELMAGPLPGIAPTDRPDG